MRRGGWLFAFVLAGCTGQAKTPEPVQAREAYPGLTPVPMAYLLGMEACLTDALRGPMRDHKLVRVSAATRPCSTAETVGGWVGQGACPRPVITFETVRSTRQRDYFHIDGTLLASGPAQVVVGTKDQVMLGLPDGTPVPKDAKALCRQVDAAVRGKVLARF